MAGSKDGDANDPLDPLEGATTRMIMPPAPEDAASRSRLAEDAASRSRLIDKSAEAGPMGPSDTVPAAEGSADLPRPDEDAADYSQGWDTRPPPDLLPPSADHAITHRDLTEHARRMQQANAATRPEIDGNILEKVVLGRPIAIPTSDPAAIRPLQGVMLEPPPANVPKAAVLSAPISDAEMMPEEATLAGGPPAPSSSGSMRLSDRAPDRTADLEPDRSQGEEVFPPSPPIAPPSAMIADAPMEDDPSQTMQGPLALEREPSIAPSVFVAEQRALAQTADEAPTWAPEHNSPALLKAAQAAAREGAAAQAAAREAAAQAAAREQVAREHAAREAGAREHAAREAAAREQAAREAAARETAAMQAAASRGNELPPGRITPAPRMASLQPDPAPPQREPSAVVAARRAPTKIDDAAIVDAALGQHQRYMITLGFALLGLLAGIAAALLL